MAWGARTATKRSVSPVSGALLVAVPLCQAGLLDSVALVSYVDTDSD